ncbi:MAG: transcription antitermination factor NusB [Capsulimonadales bacterium]|nr:transcription antitermination factor NusB [Capsulimonadales bacterium]
MAKANSSRRAAREIALRVLYTVDIGKQPVEDVLSETIEANEERLDERTAEFARSLVHGTLRARREIDNELDRVAVGFPTVRQTAVDRNILRLAAAEILFGVSDAPSGAVVNEAVELAKKYSTNESGRFVNGVLGALVRDGESRAATASMPADSPSGGTADE